MNDKLVTALAGVLVLLPNLAVAVTGLTLTPQENFMLLVLAAIGAAILKVQPGGALSDEDVERIAQAREKLRREERDKINAAGNRG